MAETDYRFVQGALFPGDEGLSAIRIDRQPLSDAQHEEFIAHVLGAVATDEEAIEAYEAYRLIQNFVESSHIRAGDLKTFAAVYLSGSDAGDIYNQGLIVAAVEGGHAPGEILKQLRASYAYEFGDQSIVDKDGLSIDIKRDGEFTLAEIDDLKVCSGADSPEVQTATELRLGTAAWQYELIVDGKDVYFKTDRIHTSLGWISPDRTYEPVVTVLSEEHPARQSAAAESIQVN